MLVQTRLSELRAMFEDVIRQSSLTKPSLPEIIDIDEVCRITGYKRATIYDFLHKRILPCHKPAHGGRRVFFKRSEIIAFMQKTRINTREESFESHDQFVESNQTGKARNGKRGLTSAEVQKIRAKIKQIRGLLEFMQSDEFLNRVRAATTPPADLFFEPATDLEK